jgi:hypothetical protein
MTITDEMVEKAADAYGAFGPGNRNKFHDSNMRAALEAVAPMLQKALTDADICRAKAQGMREAAKMAREQLSDYCSEYWEALDARAQELDPQ